MKYASRTHESLEDLTKMSLLTALTILFAVLSEYIHLGIFNISLALIPISIGAAMMGGRAGAWLGFVNGMSILLAGQASAFLVLTFPGTVITVLAKGILCGIFPALVYAPIAKRNKVFGITLSAVLCPIVNTGVFFLGCVTFFLEPLKESAGDASVISYIITTVIGGNFLAELAVNLILVPPLFLSISSALNRRTKDD